MCVCVYACVNNAFELHFIIVSVKANKSLVGAATSQPEGQKIQSMSRECFLCVHVGSFRVLRLPPTASGHAFATNWQLSVGVDASVDSCPCRVTPPPRSNCSWLSAGEELIEYKLL